MSSEICRHSNTDLNWGPNKSSQLTEPSSNSFMSSGIEGGRRSQIWHCSTVCPPVLWAEQSPEATQRFRNGLYEDTQVLCVFWWEIHLSKLLGDKGSKGNVVSCHCNLDSTLVGPIGESCHDLVLKGGRHRLPYSVLGRPLQTPQSCWAPAMGWVENPCWTNFPPL